MSGYPFMVSAKDNTILGAASNSDAMGTLAVWSERGRDLVPHLTEQTTSIRGFQLLFDAFHLWEIYEPRHSQHAGRLDDFFLLIEQTFARTIASLRSDVSQDYFRELPGARRLRARAHEIPHISLQDRGWHLLDNQKANGIWGLYRGAAGRAGFLEKNLLRLSSATAQQAEAHCVIKGAALQELFELVDKAMDGKTPALKQDPGGNLASKLIHSFTKVPLAHHLHQDLIEGHDLTKHLTAQLAYYAEWNHRKLLANLREEQPQFSSVIDDVLRCENLLAVAETLFLAMCAGRGKKLEELAATLPLDLESLERARQEFSSSGVYFGATAIDRHRLLCEGLDTSKPAVCLGSVLKIHEQVCQVRNRSPWVWVEDGVLRSEIDVDPPSESEFVPGVAWRNDYYLQPLHAITAQLAQVRS